jgi:hypothetical protein
VETVFALAHAVCMALVTAGKAELGMKPLGLFGLVTCVAL